MADLYLLDTTVASVAWDGGREGNEQARTFLEDLRSRGTVVISVVTIGEIEYGLRVSPKADARRQAMMREAMRAYSLVKEITRHTAIYWAETRAKLFKRHATAEAKGRLREKWPEDLVDRTTARSLGVQENDIWLAAQAREWNAFLVTGDRMDRIAMLSLDPPLRMLKWRKDEGG